MSSYFNAFTSMAGSVAEYTGLSGMASAAAQFAPHAGRFIGSASGAFTAVTGAKRIYNNMQADGTWGGVAHGALELAGGIAGIASVGATGSARLALGALNAGASAFSAFHTAQTTDPAAAQASTLTRLAQGSINMLRVPIQATAAATGVPALNTLAQVSGHLGTASTVTHQVVTHGPRALRVAEAVRGAL